MSISSHHSTRTGIRRFPGRVPAPGRGVDPDPLCLVKGNGSSDQSRAVADALAEVSRLEGQPLGLRVAQEVMGWRLVPGHLADTWVDSNGGLTGYYDGRPFSPYRDRNALGVVWQRITDLGLRRAYVLYLCLLSGEESSDSWSIHTCGPDLSCRAALLAVRLPD